MGKEFKSRDLLTVPNILTILRIVLILPFVICFYNHNYVMAAIIVVLSGLSDCFDGFIARKFNQITEIGKVLDPIADKLTLIAIVVCVAFFMMPEIISVMIILITKDLLMLIGGTDLIKKGIKPPAAKWYGKVSTLVFYFSISLIVFLKAAFNYENTILTIILLSITTVLMLYSLVNYAIIYFSLIREYKAKINN